MTERIFMYSIYHFIRLRSIFEMRLAISTPLPPFPKHPLSLYSIPSHDIISVSIIKIMLVLYIVLFFFILCMVPSFMRASLTNFFKNHSLEYVLPYIKCTIQPLRYFN